jgi:hypothetical protein
MNKQFFVYLSDSPKNMETPSDRSEQSIISINSNEELENLHSFITRKSLNIQNILPHLNGHLEYVPRPAYNIIGTFIFYNRILQIDQNGEQKQCR